MASPFTSAGNSRRILGTLGVLGAIGALATAGTYSLFTDSVTAGPQSIASGSFDLSDNGVNTLAVAATGVAPGDTVQRTVDLLNNGSVGFSAVNMSIAASTSSLLNTDATNGLQVQVDKCSVAWTPAGNAFTCGGTTTAVVTSRAVLASIGSLGALNALAPAGVDHLKVTLTLPTSADNTFQNLTSGFNYTFDAIQRAGVAK